MTGQAQPKARSASDLRQQVATLLRESGHMQRQLFRRRIRDMPVTAGEARTLLYLGAHQGSTQTRLADLVDIQPITLTRQIDRLADAGLVVRCVSPDDRRARLLHLTPQGKSLAKKILGVAHELNAEITAELEDEALEHLAAGLETMRAVLARMT